MTSGLNMTHDEYLAACANLASVFGWKVAHFPKSKVGVKNRWVTSVAYDGKGWPDLFLVHPKSGRSLAREIKVGRDKPSDEQAAWIEWLRAAGVDAGVWRPSDWDRIRLELDTKRP